MNGNFSLENTIPNSIWESQGGGSASRKRGDEYFKKPKDSSNISVKKDGKMEAFRTVKKLGQMYR